MVKKSPEASLFKLRINLRNIEEEERKNVSLKKALPLLGAIHQAETHRTSIN